MSRRIAASRLIAVSASSIASTASIRSLWNSCLQPSLVRCQCARRTLTTSTSQHMAPHRSHPAFAPSSSPVAARTPLCERRLFSSPALSSTSATPDLPPSLPTSAPLTDAIELTDAAARRIGELRARHGAGMYLRLSVDSGGCSGLSYKFEIDKQGQQPDDLSDHTTHSLALRTPPHFQSVLAAYTATDCQLSSLVACC